MDVKDYWTEYMIALAVIAGLWIVFTIITLTAIYWTHYPYGRKRRRKWRQRK